MNFNEMKLAIYESYTDGEISKVTCDKLISSLDSRMGNICVKEMVNAENEFIRASISVVNESADYDYLTEAAKTFSEKVKAGHGRSSRIGSSQLLISSSIARIIRTMAMESFSFLRV